MTDLDRMTKAEAWRAGFVAGKVEVEEVAPEEAPKADKPGFYTSEFWVTAVTVAFSIWVGYRMMVDTEIDLERGAAIIGLVVAAAWKYTDMRTTLKLEPQAKLERKDVKTIIEATKE